MHRPVLRLFYALKPGIPRRVQIEARRARARHLLRGVRDHWPISPRAVEPPPNWKGWPGGKQFAVVLTHDVESADGLSVLPSLMQSEQARGFCSSFNFVAEKYEVPPSLRQELAAGGFEVGLHGLRHDGRLFLSRRTFLRRAPRINRLLKEWRAVGFRAPGTIVEPAWIKDLDIEYDSSTFDNDPFEPRPGGHHTIFPFTVGPLGDGPSYVELPYTLPQDFTLFVLLGETSIDIWKKKLAWIAERGGMALFLTHPDYMTKDDPATRVDQYPIAWYEELLDHLRSQYEGKYWHALPRDVARYWRTEVGERRAPCQRKIWIDLDNTPHVPFFKPIIRDLERQGHQVLVTARDAFQVCALADRMNVPYIQVGKHYGKNRLRKILGLSWRAWQLLPLILKERPDLAVSHGARSQIMLANLLRIPSVLLEDYEHAQFPWLMRPRWIIAPDVIAAADNGSRQPRMLSYPGIKEDVYVGEFSPESNLRRELGLEDDRLIAVVRPPATEAHYHSTDSEVLFVAAMERAFAENDSQIVLLPRNPRQLDWMRANWPHWFENGKVVVPKQAVDGLNLLWHADVVISGGGTMNREAAALGVPVYSVFRGPIGAVDRSLADEGRLVLLEKPEQVPAQLNVARRTRATDSPAPSKDARGAIVRHLQYLLENANR